MDIEYNDAKRLKILQDESRGFDIARAGRVFDDFHLTKWDEAHSDDEDRFITVGLFDEEVVIVVWTERPNARRIITMWKADDKERKGFFRRRDSG